MNVCLSSTILLQEWGSNFLVVLVITHRMTLDEINEGFEVMKRGDCIRLVLTWKSLRASAAQIIFI